MSFRKEEKLKIDKSKLFSLYDWIVKNGGYELYPSRIVSSTYFDNDMYNMYQDSEEGVVPRKKIRVRSYANIKHSQNNSTLEMKISSVEGRYKTQDKVVNLEKLFNYGMFDVDYGVVKPVVRVSYVREYYKINKIRLTIDRDIQYSSLDLLFNNNRSVFDEDIIVELKAGNQVSNEFLNRSFPFDRVRFSKYSRSISLLQIK
jgi:hypothetical protein